MAVPQIAGAHEIMGLLRSVAGSQWWAWGDPWRKWDCSEPSLEDHCHRLAGAGQMTGLTKT